MGEDATGTSRTRARTCGTWSPSSRRRARRRTSRRETRGERARARPRASRKTWRERACVERVCRGSGSARSRAAAMDAAAACGGGAVAVEPALRRDVDVSDRARRANAAARGGECRGARSRERRRRHPRENHVRVGSSPRVLISPCRICARGRPLFDAHASVSRTLRAPTPRRRTCPTKTGSPVRDPARDVPSSRPAPSSPPRPPGETTTSSLSVFRERTPVASRSDLAPRAPSPAARRRRI